MKKSLLAGSIEEIKDKSHKQNLLNSSKQQKDFYLPCYSEIDFNPFSLLGLLIFKYKVSETKGGREGRL